MYQEAHPGDSAIRSSDITLTVFAAASLSEAFTEISSTFEKQHPGVKVLLNLAGSQQLAQQIKLGAPADVFASANQQQMQLIIGSGRVDSAAPQPFTRNHLVVIAPRNGSPAIRSLSDLATLDPRIIMADEAVPAGHYSRQFLNKASLLMGASYATRVLSNVVSYELNVRSVLTKISLGEADAGIVYASDLMRAENIFSIPIPDSLNADAIYPIAPLSDSAYPELASAFITFVKSPAGQAILAAHGFETML